MSHKGEQQATNPPTEDGKNVLSLDAKYSSYVSFYNSLDDLLWKNVAVLISITAIGLTAIGAIIEKKLVIPPFTQNHTAALVCFLVSVLLFNTIFTVWRMRFHHELMEAELRKIETSGYFHARLKSTKNQWWLAAPLWTRIIFSAVALSSLGLGVYFYVKEDIKMEKQSIDADRARTEFGITANHENMENGELRFRLMGQDGNGYIRTVASEKGGWQKSHSHKEFKEAYVVETKWMAVAVKNAAGEPDLTIYRPGEVYITNLAEVHNIYLPPGAVIHTVKFGARTTKTSWIADEEFTLKTKEISEAEILQKRK